MKATDLIIVGGGIAGCSLAWQAYLRNIQVVLIDAPSQDSSSRVAAGLVTPITGARLAISWRWSEFFPAADAMYRSAERVTGTSFWSVAPAWRFFSSVEEASRFKERWDTDIGREALSKEGIHLRSLENAPLPSSKSHFGGMTMEPAARLDTLAFLNATHAFLRSHSAFHALRLDCDRDIQATREEVRIPSLGLSTPAIVLCQGVLARSNGWFSELPLHPARGDILEIQSTMDPFTRVVHAHAWAVPLGQRRYLLGATYDRTNLDTRVDQEKGRLFREQLCERWTSLTGEEVSDQGMQITAHRAGVRPASYDRHPLIGAHPTCPRVWCMNGLGSKGSLMAPALAGSLVSGIVEGEPIDPTLRWDRRRP